MMKPKECQKMGGENRGFSPPHFSLSFRVHCSRQFFLKVFGGVCWGDAPSLGPPPRGTQWALARSARVGRSEDCRRGSFAPPHPTFTVFFSQFGLSSLDELLLRRTLK